MNDPAPKRSVWPVVVFLLCIIMPFLVPLSVFLTRLALGG